MPEACLGWSVQPQVDLYKLRNKLHSYAQIYKSQKFDNQKETRDAEVRTWTQRNITYNYGVSPARRATTYKYILIYISIYIYGVHCGKVLIFENLPGHKIIRPAQHGFCLKVVTHPSTNPARPGLTSELVCLASPFSAAIPYLQSCSLELFPICSVGRGSSLSSICPASFFFWRKLVFFFPQNLLQ